MISAIFFSLALFCLLWSLPGPGICTVFPGELGVSSVTRSLPTSCCPTNGMRLAVLNCPRCPRCPCWDHLGFVRVRWVRRGWLMSLCLCCPSSNGDYQTSAALPLHLHVCHWDQPQCVSDALEEMLPTLQFSGLQAVSSAKQYSLLQPLFGSNSSSYRVRRSGQAKWLCFSAWQ